MRLVDIWIARRGFTTPLGHFEVDLDAPPDLESLQVANDLIEFVSRETDAILRVVENDYQLAAEDKYWMKGCDVPHHLDKDQLTTYLRSRTISVRRDQRGQVTGAIFISPMWDLEHGIHLGVKNGGLFIQSY